MKTKFIALFALMLCMGVFIFPVYAGEVLPPTVRASVSGDILRVDVRNGTHDTEAVFVNGERYNFRVDSVLQIDLLALDDAETITVYAIDFAGNRSNTVTVNNPHFVPPFVPPTEGIPVTSPREPNPFTPDGQASVLDHADDGDNKEFFTFQTPAGNVFFLIVDHDRQSDNVYFLNAVTERDLMDLAEQSGEPLHMDIGGIPVSPNPTLPSEPQDEDGEDEAEEEAPPASGGGNTGTMIFLLIGVAAFGGVAYYLKIVRPKQQGTDDEDYADEGMAEQDLGEEMQFATEQDESDVYAVDDSNEDEVIVEDDGL